MNAEEWKARIKAVMRAAAAGDEAPLGIVCDELANLTKPVAKEIHIPAKSAVVIPRDWTIPKVPNAGSLTETTEPSD